MNESTNETINETAKTNNIFHTGMILSTIGAWITMILLFWTVIFLVLGIVELILLSKIKQGNTNYTIAASVLAILFGGIFGIIGGIMMLVGKP